MRAVMHWLIVHQYMSSRVTKAARCSRWRSTLPRRVAEAGWFSSVRVGSGHIGSVRVRCFLTRALHSRLLSFHDSPLPMTLLSVVRSIFQARVMRCSSRTCVFCECSWYGANFRVRTYFVYVAHPVEANVNICVSVNPKGVSDIRARASHT